MTNRRARIPGIPADAERTLAGALAALEDRLAKLEGKAGRAGFVSSNTNAKPGEFLNIEAPPGGLTIILPMAGQDLRNARVVLNVTNANPVKVVTIAGVVNGAAFVLITAPGTYEAVCDGLGGWALPGYVTPVGSGTPTWAATLAAGEESAGTSPVISAGDHIELPGGQESTGGDIRSAADISLDAATDIHIHAGANIHVGHAGSASTVHVEGETVEITTDTNGVEVSAATVANISAGASVTIAPGTFFAVTAGSLVNIAAATTATMTGGTGLQLTATTGVAELESLASEAQLTAATTARVRGSDVLLGATDDFFLQTGPGLTTRLAVDQDGTWYLAGSDPGTAGVVFTSQGAGSPPVWSAVDLSSVTYTAGDGVDLVANEFSADVSDFQGAGLEDDGANNLRIVDIDSASERQALTSDGAGGLTWRYPLRLVSELSADLGQVHSIRFHGGTHTTATAAIPGGAFGNDTAVVLYSVNVTSLAAALDDLAWTWTNNHTFSNSVRFDSFVQFGTSTGLPAAGDIRKADDFSITSGDNITLQAGLASNEFIDLVAGNLFVDVSANFEVDATSNALITSDILRLSSGTHTAGTGGPNGGFLQLKESSASTPSLAASFGMFWVRNDSPCVPMFTGDTNVDSQILTLADVASQTQMEAAALTNFLVTPGRQHFHPSAAKAWARSAPGGTINASYNVSSATDTAAGVVVYAFTSGFSAAAGFATIPGVTATAFTCSVTNAATGSVTITSYNTANTAADPVLWWFASFGDQ